jgi:glycyl-tRNA synthetase beta chain
MASNELLFELGTEELPAAYLPGLTALLKAEAEQLLQASHLAFRRAASFGTPRRLALVVRGLAPVQRTPGEEVRGPSKQASYDKAGKPTPALLGFLRSHGGTLNQVKLISSQKGEYVYLVKPPRTTPTAKILPALLPRLVDSLRAPKTMRWDASGVRFARPIRWLLARYGARPIRCSYGRLTSGSRTWVGGPVRPRSVSVTSVDGYLRALKRAGVILNPDERRARIERTLATLAARHRAIPAPEMVSHGLLEEVTCLVERPVPLVGGFDPRYLELPREVLLASMAKYQRVFAIESRGKIVPRFVAILDGAPRRPQGVGEVIERILNARLADSLLFWEHDRKRSLQALNQDLGGVTFHEKLGSMHDKMLRLCSLSGVLSQMWGFTPQETETLSQACEFAKADLVSTMVKEFPTLQGIIGKHYARAAGTSEVVAQAIGEQYLPLGEAMPRTLMGQALAILDKYDTLASYFSIGIEPTGDQDPFGLRRAAQGIVEVAWAVHRPLPLQQLFGKWQTAAPFATGRADAAVRIHRYLFERLYTFAWPAPKPSADFIDAVLSSPCQDLVDVMDRIQSLRRLDGKPGLLKAAKVIERTRNILKGATVRQHQVESNRFTEGPERRLWELYSSNKERVERLAQEKSYDEATVVFGDVFFAPLHEFFDRVLVNVPEEPLRENRLALMQAINTLYTERIADLSKLTVLQQREDTR